MSEQLNEACLDGLPDAVARPSYDRSAVGTGLVHLGLGAFHRAHQAVYTDDVLGRDGGDWGILGVSLRNPGVRDSLAPQDGLYTVVSRDGDGETARVIGAIKEVVFAPDDPPRLLARMADPAIRVVSLTVTEKGYCHDPATGRLRADDPDIAHDLANPERPRTAIGYLVSALAMRRAASESPFTILCCDNLPRNGKVVRGIVLDFAGRRDPALAAWISENVPFPSTMIDRIVPAATDADRARVATLIGFRDDAAVIAEPFRQWVIEETFARGRPAWEKAGAEMVADVAPYEEMKLRLLNGSHSILAYLGYLGGFEFISETMDHPSFHRFIRDFMDEEVSPTLNLPPGVDLGSYKAALLERFANPALRHRTWQIAMDGSQKLPQRLLDTARDRLAAGAPPGRLALGVAAWMRYATGIDEQGREIDLRDPMANRLRRAAGAAGNDPSALVDAMLGHAEIFGHDLQGSPVFRAAVGEAMTGLMARGARATVELYGD